MSNIGPTGPTGIGGWTFQQGSPGEPGPTGPQGQRGIPGTAEYKGDKGDIGPQGFTGPTGCTGPTGPTGAVGASSTAVNTFRYRLSLPSGSQIPNPGRFRFSEDIQRLSNQLYINSRNYAQDALGNDISDVSGNNIAVFLETIN